MESLLEATKRRDGRKEEELARGSHQAAGRIIDLKLEYGRRRKRVKMRKKGERKKGEIREETWHWAYRPANVRSGG